MSKEVTTPIAHLGIGYGREHIGRAIESHARQMGLNAELVDLLPYLGDIEARAALFAYSAASRIPGIYNFLRALYEGSGPKTVDVNVLSARFPKDSPVISVSPIASEMLSRVGGIRIYHMVGDRRVQKGDVTSSAALIGIMADDIEDVHLAQGRNTVVLGGLAQPVQYLNDDVNEKKRRLELDARPHVLFSVNGAGGMGRIKNVVTQLAPLVAGGRIRFSVFVGHHQRELEVLKGAAEKVELPLQKGETPIEAKSGRIYEYSVNDRSEAIRVRQEILPYVDLIIPASPMELVNLASVVLVDMSTVRNANERANARYSTSRGWAMEIRGNLAVLVEGLFTPVNSVTPAQRLYDQALKHNNPRAAGIFLENVMKG